MENWCFSSTLYDSYLAQTNVNIANREKFWTERLTHTPIYTSSQHVLLFFNRAHLDQRGMTSFEETRERLRQLIVQMLPFSCTPRSHPCGFPAVFPAVFSGFNSRILSVKLWLHCLVLASQLSTSEIFDDSSLLDTVPEIFYRGHSFILAYR